MFMMALWLLRHTLSLLYRTRQSSERDYPYLDLRLPEPGHDDNDDDDDGDDDDDDDDNDDGDDDNDDNDDG